MIWKQNPPENIWSSSHNARAPTENFEIVMSLNSWKKRLRWGLAWNGFILEMIWRVKSEGGRGEWNGKRKSQWGVLDWVCCKEMGPQRALVQNASLRGAGHLSPGSRALPYTLQLVFSASSCLCFSAACVLFDTLEKPWGKKARMYA